MTDHHPFSKFTKWFNNIILRNRFVARTHTPRQNKDDSAFEQGSNKTVIVIKNKNAISCCHGNQHSRTPGNVVKHATEHKAAKQVKRLFIRLRRVVQCPLVRAQERHKLAPKQAKIQGIVPQEHHPGAAQLGRNGTGHRQPAQVRLAQSCAGVTAGHAPTAALICSCPSHEHHREPPRAPGNISGGGMCQPPQGQLFLLRVTGPAKMKATAGMVQASKHNPWAQRVFLRTESGICSMPRNFTKISSSSPRGGVPNPGSESLELRDMHHSMRSTEK